MIGARVARHATMLDWLLAPEALAALVALTALELVLGVDNVIFVTIVAAKLPAPQQQRARRIGLSLAVIGRIGLLFSIVWLLGLTVEVFALFGRGISLRDLILIAGGLFLIFSAVRELHQNLEGEADETGATATTSFAAALTQIVALDIVFALDSIITAVGMARDVRIMALAIVVSAAMMIVLAGYAHRLVSRHPTIKVLALAFLLMIGLVLIAEAFDVHVPKGYVYFAMGFALLVEILNIRRRQPGHRARKAATKSR